MYNEPFSTEPAAVGTEPEPDQDTATEDESGAADDGEFDRAAISEDSTGVEL